MQKKHNKTYTDTNIKHINTECVFLIQYSRPRRNHVNNLSNNLVDIVPYKLRVKIRNIRYYAPLITSYKETEKTPPKILVQFKPPFISNPEKGLVLNQERENG